MFGVCLTKTAKKLLLKKLSLLKLLQQPKHQPLQLTAQHLPLLLQMLKLLRLLKPNLLKKQKRLRLR
ncbi:Uncharacterised protein [Mycobacteroides abscessus subsp. massiliense]|nr:Uncharacterised protein [Mycobacteroides abscessus subsp. massiliense]